MTKPKTYVPPAERVNRDLTHATVPVKITKVPGLPTTSQKAKT